MIDIRKFEEWCASDIPRGQSPVPGEIDVWLRQSGGTISNYLENVLAGRRERPVRTTIPGEATETQKEIRLCFPEKNKLRIPTDKEHNDIDELIVHAGRKIDSLSIENAAIKFVHLNGRTNAIFKNCLISNFEIPPPSLKTHNLFFENCWIGHLSLKGNSIEDFTFIGGGVLDIRCPPPAHESPFSGSVTLSQDVFFPIKRSTTRLYRGPQSYRNLRAHLEKLQNIPATNLLRARELAAECDPELGADSAFTRGINRAYGILSGYGEKPGKPMVWLVIVWLIAFVMIYACDQGGRIGLPAAEYVGARAVLNDPKCGRFARSMFLPIEATFNPLGAYNARSLVVTNTVPASIFVRVTGLFSDVLLFLSILAIRRRFKLP